MHNLRGTFIILYNLICAKIHLLSPPASAPALPLPQKPSLDPIEDEDENNRDKAKAVKKLIKGGREEGMFYGSLVWDPWLIVAQMATLQCLHYLTLGLFLSLLVGTPRVTLLYFFDFATLSPSSLTGWAVIASFLLASLAGAWYMLYVIERSKKCLDFSATLHIVHLFVCTLYGGWPSSLAWWVVNGVGLAGMALLGEYLCVRRELMDIPIARLRSNV